MEKQETNDTVLVVGFYDCMRSSHAIAPWHFCLAGKCQGRFAVARHKSKF
jgi:hypothetical protein